MTPTALPPRVRDASAATGAVYLYLQVVDEARSTAELATDLGLSETTVQRAVRRLQKAGHVTQDHDPDDLRRTEYRVTKKGVQFDVEAETYRARPTSDTHTTGEERQT